MPRHSDRYSDDWSGAVCAQVGAEAEVLFFPLGPGPGDAAKAMCRVCPMAHPCLTLAMDEERGMPRNDRFGIRGGLTAQERHQLDMQGQVAA